MTDRLYATFYIDDTLFGIDATDVQEVLRAQPMTSVPLAPADIKGLINLRGQIVVAVDLRERLGRGPAPDDVQSLNVVVRTEHGPVSLIVDDIGDVLKVSDDALERPPETITSPTRDLVVAVHKLDEQLMLVVDAKRTAEPMAA
ncbi:MAG: purine-binding chemotaxis protein CheW [Actinobacteria bacterium]|nr:purine-binding chemotaxis protein CheW [Actinomycetota bacterium]